MGSAPSSLRSSSLSTQSTVERVQSASKIPDNIRQEFEEADDFGRGVLDEQQLELLLSRRAYKWRQQLIEETVSPSGNPTYYQPAILNPAKRALLKLKDKKKANNVSDSQASPRPPDEFQSRNRRASESAIDFPGRRGRRASESMVQDLSPTLELQKKIADPPAFSPFAFRITHDHSSNLESLGSAESASNQNMHSQGTEDLSGRSLGEDPADSTMARTPSAPDPHPINPISPMCRARSMIEKVPSDGYSGPQDFPLSRIPSNESVESQDSEILSPVSRKFQFGNGKGLGIGKFKTDFQTNFLGAHLTVSTFSSLTHRRDRQLARMAANFIVRNFHSNQDGVLSLEEFWKWDRFGGNEKLEPSEWICDGMEEAHKREMKYTKGQISTVHEESQQRLDTTDQKLLREGSRTEKYWRRLSLESGDNEIAPEARLLMAGRRPSIGGLRAGNPSNRDLHGTVPVQLKKAHTGSKLIMSPNPSPEKNSDVTVIKTTTPPKGTTPVLIRRRSNSLNSGLKLKREVSGKQEKEQNSQDSNSPNGSRLRRRKSSGMGHELLLFKFKQLTGVTGEGTTSPINKGSNEVADTGPSRVSTFQ